MTKISDKVRTIVTFYKTLPDGQLFELYEKKYKKTVSNVVVGQTFAMDHPQLEKSLKGVVFNISHGCYLGPELPVCYIDVEVK